MPITNKVKFRSVLLDSMCFASREKVLLTIGIKPEEPATGYGYIQVKRRSRDNISKSLKSTFFNVKKFIEKPSLVKAKRYLKSGDYRWNAGMFVFSFATMVESLLKHQPAMHEACERWFQAAASSAKLKRALKKDYEALKPLSFDYGIMEHAQNVLVADGDFEWDDLGSWPAVSRHLKPDAEGNCVEADFVHVDSARNVVFDARTKKNRQPIALVGLRDCVVVQTNDTTLVAHKRATHKMRDLIAKLAESRAHKHLV